MIKISFVAFLILLISYQINCENSQVSQTDNDVYIIEHSIDANEFKEIGKLNMRTIRQNQNSLHLQNMASYDESTDENRYITASANVFSTKIESNDLDAETLDQLLTFKSHDDDNIHHHGQNSTLYRLRLCKRETTQKVCFASTFTYLKNVIDSNMRINLTIYTGINNFINSISIKSSPTLKGDKDSSKSLKKNDLPNHLNMFVYIQNIKTAVGPDTESYLEKVKKEMEQKEKSAQGGNESFLSKYWIYIVPVMIVMFLMNLANPEGGAAPGGR
jgi:hypothetical protein